MCLKSGKKDHKDTKGTKSRKKIVLKEIRSRGERYNREAPGSAGVSPMHIKGKLAKQRKQRK
jgi:hypothetical protein